MRIRRTVERSPFTRRENRERTMAWTKKIAAMKPPKAPAFKSRASKSAGSWNISMPAAPQVMKSVIQDPGPFSGAGPPDPFWGEGPPGP